MNVRQASNVMASLYFGVIVGIPAGFCLARLLPETGWSWIIALMPLLLYFILSSPFDDDDQPDHDGADEKE